MKAILFLFYLFSYCGTEAVECLQCTGDYGGVRCGDTCTGELCVVWKWTTRSETLIRQGCLSGLDRGYTAKVGCRTNNLGATLCLCDGELCNSLERTEITISTLPVVRLPVVECISKVTGTDIFGSKREHICASNYCHMMRTETYSEGPAPDVVNVYNCADVAEFDFDVRIKSTSGVPGLYANGCYKIQLHPRDTITDCTCSRNHCNNIFPVVTSGAVRCYLSQPSYNDSEVDVQHFCDGDFCFIQRQDKKFVKGCISVNERNSWSHIRSGHRHILGVDQWFCQSHLCNFNLQRTTKSIASARSHFRSTVRSGTEKLCDNFSALFVFFVTFAYFQ